MNSATPAIPRSSHFPTTAGILLGLALGGFFDGIVFHQVLQWHHMLSSAGHAPTDLDQLRFDIVWDGLFNVLTYAFLVAGLVMLWRAARRTHVCWSARALAASVLIGFGLFNLVEGIVNHHLLGIHHVNETVPMHQWIYWDLGFLAWGAAMLAVGLRLRTRGVLATRM